ncbi:glycosyltransferase family 2 protein [Adhaeribacter pallidiroseus]|uniref:Putative teichuronic acid biosynthesis glycosyltransferase TuaG n=1 Tax=Adhaeribacter pallidiroseus TaxID=2072847 RepID=A0A369QLJ2_9BACT|nr:glycosyltransferase family 2 protein [Adhaeribacter pallidiroseus]RDC64117.1 putative teichuronic acid biosynthesis glycosyltransferase TuaG [Adhaeribacter pallidiroseus]
MQYPKISIVTPNYNQSEYLEETILSIITQNYPNLEYIIIDGGSSDNSVNIIMKYEKYLSYWVSESDNGLYYALQKGFEKSSGEIMGWLNSDDLLHRKSLYVIANIFNNNLQVNWLQGRPTIYDESGMTVDSSKPIFSKYYFYNKKYVTGKFIQQESTYWRRSLWNKAGKFISSDYKYAGDFELWMRFFNYELLHYTHALIGGYRVRSSQMSRIFYNEYLQECSTIIEQLLLSTDDINHLNKIKFLENVSNSIRFVKPMLYKFIEKLYGLQDPIMFNFSKGIFSA